MQVLLVTPIRYRINMFTIPKGYYIQGQKGASVFSCPAIISCSCEFVGDFLFITQNGQQEADNMRILFLLVSLLSSFDCYTKKYIRKNRKGA
jgi:hypothetical protein